MPSADERSEILQKMMAGVKTELDHFYDLGNQTSGYVASDLQALISEAAHWTLLRRQTASKPGTMESENSEFRISNKDFQQAFDKICPLSKKSGFSNVPSTSWKDIGALTNLKLELKNAIIRPLRDPERCKKFGIRLQAGILLYGPPGCGKTMLAKAVANAAGANFISIKGPELMNKYVGESEKAVRSLFQRARESSPCLIFFDEFDALCPKRGTDGNQVTERIVNQLLTEMNGVEELRNVFLMAATNRPDIIDDAVLRPGRLGTHLYVPVPEQGDRLDILKTLTREMPMDPKIDLDRLSQRKELNNFTGADLRSLCENAARSAAWTDSEKQSVDWKDFENAMLKTKSSIQGVDLGYFERLRKTL